MTGKGTSPEWVEGRVAFLADLSDSDNPHLTKAEKGKLKEEWNQQAQDWDDGWCEAKTQEDEENEENEEK